MRRKIITFCVENFITFCINVITFCVSITFCGDSYYILRRFLLHFAAIITFRGVTGLENEFLENKSGRIFDVRQVYLTKSCQQIWVRVNQHFILFIQHFTNFQDKYSEPSKHTWAFSKTVQKISKNPYTASRFSLLTSAKFSVSIKRVTLQHNK